MYHLWDVCAHAIAVARCLTVAILSHWIKLAFWTAWPQVVTCIKDEAMDKAHGKLSWYQDWYEEATKSIKALEVKIFSEKDCCCKVETKQFELEMELDNLQKEVKTLGKHKASPVSHEWCEWDSELDSDTAEKLLSKGSRKQQRCDHTAPELPARGMIPFPNAPPMDVGPGNVLSLIGHRDWWRGTKHASANWDCWAHGGFNTSSMGEGRSPSIHNRETTLSAWEIQAQTKIVANLWSRIPKHSANYKSSSPSRLNGQTTCNNFSHGKAQEAAKLFWNPSRLKC